MKLEGREARIPEWLFALGAIGIGMLFCFVAFGWNRLNPFHYEWLMVGDKGQLLLGWFFGREAPWSFPLGKLATFPDGLGTFLAFLGMPLYLSFWKIFNPFLPQFFQFFGIWLMLCYALQALFAYLILRHLNRNRVTSYLGAAFLTASPILLFRGQHLDSSAHWIVLAAIWLIVKHRFTSKITNRDFFSWSLLLLLASGTHVYILAMVLALSFVLTWEALRNGQKLKAAGFVLFCFGFSLVALYCFGFIGSGLPAPAPGFSYFSADLLTFVNSMGNSVFLSGLSESYGQYEGFGYLGIGNLLLLIVLGFTLRENRGLVRAPFLGPLIFIAFSLLCFSFGSTVRVAGQDIFDIEFLYRPFALITAAFRAPGRFIWPLYYLISLGISFSAGRLAQLKPGWLLLFMLALGLQWHETLSGLAPIWDPKHPTQTGLRQESDLDELGLENENGIRELETPVWEKLAKTHKRISLVPPYLNIGGGKGSCALYTYDYFLPYALLAYRHGMTINSANLARLSELEARDFCLTSEKKFLNGNLDEDTLYIVMDNSPHYIEARKRHALCREIGSQVVCIAKTSKNGWLAE